MRWKAFIEEFRFLPEPLQDRQLTLMTLAQRRDFAKALEAYPPPGQALVTMSPEQRADFENSLEKFGFRTTPPPLSQLTNPSLV